MNLDSTDTLVTRTGFRFFIRPVAARDEERLRDFFRRVTPEDLRFRFLRTMREPSHDLLAAMVATEDERMDSYLAMNERGEVIATAMLVGDEARRRAEVAISIRADFKERGIGWTLLDYLVGCAQASGYASIESLEDRDSRSAIAVARDMGFTTEPVEDDPTLVRVGRRLR